MKIWGLTDRGTVREQNQDTFHQWVEDNPAALLVCDGMGGARAGNVASALAVQAFTEAIQHSDAQPEARLTAALARANEQGCTSVPTRTRTAGGWGQRWWRRWWRATWPTSST